MPCEQTAAWLRENQAARYGQDPLQGDGFGRSDQSLPGEEEMINPRSG